MVFLEPNFPVEVNNRETTGSIATVTDVSGETTFIARTP